MGPEYGYTGVEAGQGRKGIERSKSFSQGLKFKNYQGEIRPGAARPQTLEFDRLRMVSRSNSQLASPPRRTLPRPPRKELSRSNSHLPSTYSSMVARSTVEQGGIGGMAGIGAQEYYQQFHSDFVLYNETRRLSDKPVQAITDVNSNCVKVGRSNSRLANAMRKLFPRKKQKHCSEVSLTGVYNNHKYVIRVNDEVTKETENGGWQGARGKVGIGRNKSFLQGNKVRRSNSVMPGFLRQKQQDEHRTVVDIGGGREEFPWNDQDKTKDNVNNNINNSSGNNNNINNNKGNNDKTNNDTTTSSIQCHQIYDVFPTRLAKEENVEEKKEDKDEEEDEEEEDEEEEEEEDDSGKFSPSSPIVSSKVSRRAIITKSTKESGRVEFTSEDQWFSKERLYKDHIAEVFEKWDNIEDEIWAKVIILERNRRVAKAYARAPILTVNGSEDGFDGFKIGVNGFDNPLRDYKVKEFKAQIGAGCKLKMGDNGDILVKRVGKGNIYIKNILEETAVSNEILKLPNGLLELDRALKLFDMKKFKQNMHREMKRQYPDRSKIETQCVSTLAFVKNEAEVLDSPIWIMIINIVALEMLGDRMPKLGADSGSSPARKEAKGVSGSSDEDPYSLTASASSRSGSGKTVPDKTRDLSLDSDSYLPANWPLHRQPREEIEEDEYVTASHWPRARHRERVPPCRDSDPYYSGYSARVPAFVGGQKTERASRRDERRYSAAPSQGDRGQGLDPTWLHMKKYQDRASPDTCRRQARHLSPGTQTRLVSQDRTGGKTRWK